MNEVIFRCTKFRTILSRISCSLLWEIKLPKLKRSIGRKKKFLHEIYHLIIKYVSEEIVPEEETADSMPILMFIVELRPLSGAPYPYRKVQETHELIFSWLSWWYCLWERTQDNNNGGVMQDGAHFNLS